MHNAHVANAIISADNCNLFAAPWSGPDPLQEFERLSEAALVCSANDVRFKLCESEVTRAGFGTYMDSCLRCAPCMIVRA